MTNREVAMTLSAQGRQAVEDFFHEIAPFRAAYRNDTLSYVAVATNGSFVLIQAALHLNSGSAPPASHFESPTVRAGRYRLDELKLDAETLVQKLLDGSVPTPDGELRFPSANGQQHQIGFTPFHSAGLQNSTRMNVLRISGDAQGPHIRQPHTDWELKAASTPYDGLQELMYEYQLGPLSNDNLRVELIAFTVGIIDGSSIVTGTKAKLAVRVSEGLDVAKVAVGVRVLGPGIVHSRSRISGSAITWGREAASQLGTIEMEVPKAAAIDCTVSYEGIAQSHSWIADKATVLNSRRAAYESFDPGLATIKDILANARTKGEARDLEAAVAWLLWMLGFAAAHLGGTRRTQDAADLIVASPSGNFAVVECTTGLLKAENKLAILHDRAQTVRDRLVLSANASSHVLPVIVTSKAREEVRPDIDQAEKLGIVVVTRETLDEGINRTIVPVDANQLYQEAERAAQAAKARHDGASTILQSQVFS